MEEILSILTVKNIAIYLIVINLTGFISMYWDKQKAKKGQWRTPEKTLLTIALIGGSIGSLIGMYTFKHKTHKTRFWIGIPVILVIQICLAIYIIIKFIKTPELL